MRDYTVFTVNIFAYIKPGQTYFNRQYMLTGKYEDADATARAWVSEQTEGMLFPGDTLPAAREVAIFAEDGAATFGVTVGATAGAAADGGSASSSSSSCVRSTKRCVGSTGPFLDARPFFFITCGGAGDTGGTGGTGGGTSGAGGGATTSYIGPDRYALAPPVGDTGGILRPYQCNGMAVGVRPTWLLLG